MGLTNQIALLTYSTISFAAEGLELLKQPPSEGNAAYALSTWSVKILRARFRHCKDATVSGLRGGGHFFFFPSLAVAWRVTPLFFRGLELSYRFNFALRMNPHWNGLLRCVK